MKILISDGLDKEGQDILTAAGHELTLQFFAPSELEQEISKYDAIVVRSATKVTKNIIDAGNLKAIARAGVGLDNIDVSYAKEKRIPVLNTPGASAISVAELAIAHIFALCRFINISNVEMRSNIWNKKVYSEGIEVSGKTLGIIGFGAIGQEVAKRALGLGMKVIVSKLSPLVTDLDVKQVSNDELFANADFITLHIPLDKSKGASIGKVEFEKMKKGVILINTARGGVVDEADLLEALNSGKVSGAGLDVFVNEPTTEAQQALLNHPRVSATPHIGGSTQEAQLRVGIEIAENLVKALN